MKSGTDEEAARLVRETENRLREQVKRAGARGVVFGLSGGVDSAVVGGLCARVFGGKCLALIMPCHSDPADLNAAVLAAQAFSLPHRVVDLSRAYDQLLQTLSLGSGASPEADPPGRDAELLARANLKARLRMCALYFHANRSHSLVIGTGNRSELEIGYFTKYGDGGVDLLPIGGLLKRDVRRVGRFLGVPEQILERPPSAGLWVGQTDEEELGLTYDVLDRYLEGEPVSPSERERIEGLRQASAHKRAVPPVGPQTARSGE